MAKEIHCLPSLVRFHEVGNPYDGSLCKGCFHNICALEDICTLSQKSNGQLSRGKIVLLKNLVALVFCHASCSPSRQHRELYLCLFISRFSGYRRTGQHPGLSRIIGRISTMKAALEVLRYMPCALNLWLLSKASYSYGEK